MIWNPEESLLNGKTKNKHVLSLRFWSGIVMEGEKISERGHFVSKVITVIWVCITSLRSEPLLLSSKNKMKTHLISISEGKHLFRHHWAISQAKVLIVLMLRTLTHSTS